MALLKFTDEPYFQIEGPEGDGFVWLICDAGSRTDWCINLGPVKQAAEVMSQR